MTETEKIELEHLTYNKFNGLGEYNNEILKQNEKRINELVEQCKKEYPNIIHYFLWICACDFVL